MAANKFRLEVRSFNEARKEFKALVQAMDPAGASSQMFDLYRVAQKEIQDALSDAGRFARDKARSNAAVTHAPRRLYQGSKPAIFSFSDFDSATDGKRKRSVLVGVRTGLSTRAKDERLFVTWGKGGKRRKDGTTSAGGFAMSLGALFERGTASARIRPRHYFSNAANSTRGMITRIVGQAYKRAVAVLNRNTP